MSKKSLRLAMCKLLLKFNQVETNKGVLYFEGELEIGNEVFVENENGEMIPAENGEYIVENTKITVEEGKISNIEEVNPEPIVEEMEGEEEPTPAPNYDEAILTLSNEIEMLKQEIENIKNEIEGIKKDATDTSIEEEFSKQTKGTKPIWDKF